MSNAPCVFPQGIPGDQGPSGPAGAKVEPPVLSSNSYYPILHKPDQPKTLTFFVNIGRAW